MTDAALQAWLTIVQMMEDEDDEVTALPTFRSAIGAMHGVVGLGCNADVWWWQMKTEMEIR